MVAAVQLPAGCASSGSQPGLALNAAGVEAAAGSQLNADNSSSGLVCTSSDGRRVADGRRDRAA